MTQTVGVITIFNNKALLVKHGQGAKHQNGVYGIPGGRIQAGESDKEAALREFMEETGLTATLNDLVEYPGNIYHARIEMKTGPEDFSFHVFKCIKYSGTLKWSNETSPEWIGLDEIHKLNLLPNIAKIIEAVKP